VTRGGSIALDWELVGGGETCREGLEMKITVRSARVQGREEESGRRRL
jgi:hypothetical protein